MSDYLTANELADLIDCKPNQRTMMVRWLIDKRWKYEQSRTGLPRVLRAYRDAKMGINNGQNKKLDEAPDLNAFVDKNRDSAPVQARRQA